MGFNSFKDLRIWLFGMDILTKTYSITETYPKNEIYGLTSQMRRAAVSIPSNIAEGHNRKSSKDFQRFLFISLGSCAELETQFEASFRLGFIAIEDKTEIINKIIVESKMIRKFISNIEGQATRHLGSQAAD